MNERIRELAVQAITERLSIDEYIEALKKEPNDFYGFRVSELQKFAELIVRECIAQCNDGDSRYFIATHFGIPEARGWLCPSCGVDRSKEGCPKGHHAALTGHCPMVGVAQ